MGSGYRPRKKIAKPSLNNRDTVDYYSNIWERGADYFGGIDDRTYYDDDSKKIINYSYSTTPEEALYYMYSDFNLIDWIGTPEEIADYYRGDFTIKDVNRRGLMYEAY